MKLRYVACLAILLLMVGCTNVSTTNPGVVGVDRSQIMWDDISSRKMSLSYAVSYKAYIKKEQANGRLITDSPQGKNLQKIARRLIDQVSVFKPAAAKYGWFIALIDDDKTLNANCGPGGKIVVFSGLLTQLKLTDDEAAAVLGHEIAHALREHSREQASSSAAFEVAGLLGSSALGGGSLGQSVISKLLQTGIGLPFSRRDEIEADMIGLELAARAGYDPHAAITLWKKFDEAGEKSSMPAFLTTHPSNADRIQVLRGVIPKVMPLYLAAEKP